MPHTPLTSLPDTATPEEKFKYLPQLCRGPNSRSWPDGALVKYDGNVLLTPPPDDDGAPEDPDIAEARANPSQWQFVGNPDGSLRHVIPVSEMRKWNADRHGS